MIMLLTCKNFICCSGEIFRCILCNVSHIPVYVFNPYAVVFRVFSADWRISKDVCYSAQPARPGRCDIVAE